MKKTVLFFIAIIMMSQVSIAQDMTWEHDTVYAFHSSGANDNDYAAHAKITNVNYTADSFVWVRTEVIKPSEWTSAVCDVNLCHDVIVDSAHFDLKKGVTGEFFFHFYSTDGNGGDASYNVTIYNRKDRSKPVTINARITAWATDLSQIDVSKINLYPNPATNKLNIELPVATTGVVKMNVINVLGQNVKSFNFTGNGSYDMNSLDNGIYFLKFEIDGLQIIKKFQISKK